MTDSPRMPPAPEPPPGTYFITGAAGFIGSHLIRRLSKAGCDVIAADVRPRSSLRRSVVPVRCDVRSRPFVRAAVEMRKVTYGIHLAALVGDFGLRSSYESINVAGTRYVLEELVAARAQRILHVSSIAAMGFDPGMLADESVPPRTEGEPYSATKAQGEEIARAMQRDGAPITIVRPGDVYGPGSEPWVDRPARMLKARQMVFVDGGSGHFAHVYVDNLIDGMFLALASEAAAGSTYILTDTEQDTTFREYFTRLADAVGAPRPRISLPRPAAMLLGRGLEAAGKALRFRPPITETAVRFVTKRCSYSIAKAQSELGYAPRVGLDEGLRRIREAYASRKPEG